MGFLGSHPGAWNVLGINLPDFGLTEKTASNVSGNRTTDLGNAYQGVYQTQPGASYTNQSGQMVSSYPSGTKTKTGTVGAGGTLSGGGGQVLGLGTTGDFGQGQAEGAAYSQYDADVASEEAMYNRNAEMAQGQIREAGTQQDNALGLLSNLFSQAGTKGQQQKDESGRMTADAIKQTGDTARNTQKGNRNVLRALGILNSTYAADKLQEPNNQFDVERSRLTSVNVDNINKIDDWLRGKKDEYDLNVKNVKDQFTSIVDRINTDLRFNGQDRLAALKAANAALNTRLSNIGQEFRAVAQNVDQAKMNYATQIANLYLNQNPSANINGILSSAMNTANQVYSPQQVGIEQKKKTLSG